MKEQPDSLKVKKLTTILHVTFVVVTIVAGFDKFTDLLTNWDLYLHPLITKILPASLFMSIVGIIEIIAGIIVWVKPRLGSRIVMLWLLLIALNLITAGHYLDVAVRDIVMAIAAYAFAQLLTLQPGEVKGGT